MAESLQGLTAVQTTILGIVTGAVDVSCTQWMLYSKTLSQQSALFANGSFFKCVVQEPGRRGSIRVHHAYNAVVFIRLYVSSPPFTQLSPSNERTHPPPPLPPSLPIPSQNVPWLHNFPPKRLHPNRPPIPPNRPNNKPHNRGNTPPSQRL